MHDSNIQVNSETVNTTGNPQVWRKIDLPWWGAQHCDWRPSTASVMNTGAIVVDCTYLSNGNRGGSFGSGISVTFLLHVYFWKGTPTLAGQQFEIQIHVLPRRSGGDKYWDDSNIHRELNDPVVSHLIQTSDGFSAVQRIKG